MATHGKLHGSDPPGMFFSVFERHVRLKVPNFDNKPLLLQPGGTLLVLIQARHLLIPDGNPEKGIHRLTRPTPPGPSPRSVGHEMRSSR